MWNLICINWLTKLFVPFIFVIFKNPIKSYYIRKFKYSSFVVGSKFEHISILVFQGVLLFNVLCYLKCIIFKTKKYANMARFACIFSSFKHISKFEHSRYEVDQFFVELWKSWSIQINIEKQSFCHNVFHFQSLQFSIWTKYFES